MELRATVKSKRAGKPDKAAPRARHGQRRGDLLAAARDCFAEHGVEGATVEQILARSGASIGSLYQHFGGKDGLAAALYLDGIDAFTRRALALFDAASEPEDKVKALVRAYFDRLEADPMMARFLMQARAYLDKTKYATDVEQRNREFMPIIAAWHQQQVALKVLRPLPADYVVAILEGPSRHFARRWLEGRSERPIAEAREVFAKAAWDALRYQGTTPTRPRAPTGTSR